MDGQSAVPAIVGVVHFPTGWHVVWAGAVDLETTYAQRVDAIRELAKRDAAEAFCERVA